MNKGDLQRLTGLSSATIAKLSKDDTSSTVRLDVVNRICNALNVQIFDVIEIVRPSEDGEAS